MSIGLRTIGGDKYNAGIAYVTIPSDIDRDQYVTDCYRNCQLSVVTEDGGFMNRLPVSPEVLGFIEFPSKPNELGTPIVYVVDEMNKHPYIISRFFRKDELGDMKEGMFKFKRKVDDGFVELSGSVEDRAINIFVDGGDKEGSVNIKLFNKNQSCKLDVDVAGDINVNASGSTAITQHKEIVVETVDPDSDDSASLHQTPTAHKFYSKQLTLNDGQEPMLLGNKWQSFMESLIDQIGAITVATVIGTQPILNKVQVLELKEKLKDILSQEGFLKQ